MNYFSVIKAIITILFFHLINKLPIELFQQVHLSPGTETYDNWQTPPVPIYDDIYLFNITNPIEFNKGEKAILEPVGPYVYQ